MHLVLIMFISTRTLVTYARTIFKPRCCLNFQSMHTQAESTYMVTIGGDLLAESTYIAHNMFGQIKMDIPRYIIWHPLISRKRNGKTRMIGGQFVVERVGVHQLSVSPNTSHPMLKTAVNFCMVIACPVWTARTYNSHPRSPWKAQQLSCPAGTWTRL